MRNWVHWNNVDHLARPDMILEFNATLWFIKTARNSWRLFGLRQRDISWRAAGHNTLKCQFLLAVKSEVRCIRSSYFGNSLWYGIIHYDTYHYDTPLRFHRFHSISGSSSSSSYFQMIFYITNFSWDNFLFFVNQSRTVNHKFRISIYEK